MFKPARVLLLLLSALTVTPFSLAQSTRELPLGHHGSLVTSCTDPRFFDESPGPEAQVSSLEHFSFTASDNTDPATLAVKVNLQPVEIKVSPKRSGEWAVEASLATPIQEGRAWIKVTGMSHDGCEQIHTWNVHAGH